MNNHFMYIFAPDPIPPFAVMNECGEIIGVAVQVATVWIPAEPPASAPIVFTNPPPLRAQESETQ